MDQCFVAFGLPCVLRLPERVQLRKSMPIELLTRQPTMRRANTSMTKATYSQPCQVKDNGASSTPKTGSVDPPGIDGSLGPVDFVALDSFVNRLPHITGPGGNEFNSLPKRSVLASVLLLPKRTARSRTSGENLFSFFLA